MHKTAATDLVVRQQAIYVQMCLFYKNAGIYINVKMTGAQWLVLIQAALYPAYIGPLGGRCDSGCCHISTYLCPLLMTSQTLI